MVDNVEEKTNEELIEVDEEVLGETSSKFSKHKGFIGKISGGDEKVMHGIVVFLLGILLVLVVFNASNASITGNVIGVKVSENEEANRPAKIELTVIEADCPDCFGIAETLEYVKGTNVHVTDEEAITMSSEKARELISKYNIEKLPTVLVFGEVDKTKLNGFVDSGDALVYAGMAPPYVDALTSEVMGRVEIVNIIDSSCEQCISLGPVSDAFVQAGVAIASNRDVEYNSDEGKLLVDEYGMNEIPAMLISKDIDYYDDMKQQIIALNPTEKNGYYKIHSTLPPYKDLTGNKILGLVEIIYLDDESCVECYDVKSNKAIIQRLGLFIDKEETLDINSPQGEQLIDKYDIVKVPIILISKGAGDYGFFEDVWKQVGSRESDAWFVMRKPEIIGTYKDLNSGSIVNPRGQEAKAQAG